MDRKYMDIMDLSVVDDIIRRLLKAGRESKQVGLSEGEIRQLCVISRDIFLGKPNLLRLRAPIRIAGDIHGQYGDLLRLFEADGYPPESNYLFLGNYVDFGRSSLETLCLLLAFKVRYPENIFLLRGNHEDAKMTRIHGFYDECKRRYNVRLWKIFSDCLNCLPVAALIDGKILCIHGGLSPELHNLAEIEHIERPTTIPDKGLLFDLLWSRPNWGSDSWGEEVIDVSDSLGDEAINGSISVNTFGKDKVIEFLDNNELDLICCGNQVVEDGYEFFAKRQLVILFSAPNFRGEYDNAGAILHVDESLMCTFEIFKPRERITSMLRKIGSSHLTTATKSENPAGGNTSTSKAASKNTSVFLGPMPAERMSNSNAGSTKVTGAKLPESSQETRPFKIDPANLYRSKSPGVKPAERRSKSNTRRSINVTANLPESSQQATRPFKIDPATKYRSESPGVKRFLGAKV